MSDKVNHQHTGPAIQFLKRLSNDMVTKDDVKSMDQALKQLFPADKDGNLIIDGNREAAADKLIKSLNELDRNGDISGEAQNLIKGVFMDEGLTSIDEISNKFLQDNVKLSLWDSFRGAPMPVEDVVAGLFPKNDQGQIVFNDETREAAAAKLIENVNGINTYKNLSQEEVDTINGIFKDPDLTSLDALTTKLKSEESLKDDWLLFKQDDSDFAMSMNAAQLESLRMLLNKYAAPLGDIIGDLFEAVIGDDHKYEPAELEARNSLAQGYNVTMNGTTPALANFLGKELPEDGSGVNGWNGPAVEGWLPEFFEDGLLNKSGQPMEFLIHHDDAAGIVQSFDSMIVQRWVDQDMVEFANDDARADFVRHSAQLMMGGDLGAEVDVDNDGQMEGFVPTLEMNGVLEFTTPEARAEFVEAVGKIQTNYNHVTKEDENGEEFEHREAEVAQEIIDIANKMDGVELKLTDSDSSSERYSSAETAIIPVLQHYVKVLDGKEYADRMAEFAGDRNDIQLDYETSNSLRQDQGPSVSAGAPPGASSAQPTSPEPASSEPASSEPATSQTAVTQENTVSQWEKKPESGDEAPSIEHGEDRSTMMIGDKPATEAFGHCASGANAVPCKLDPDAAVDNEVENDPIAWSANVKIDDLLSPG